MLISDPPPALVIHAERHQVCRGGRVVVRGLLRGTYGNGTDVTVVVVTATIAGPQGFSVTRRQTLLPDDNRFVHFGIPVTPRAPVGTYRVTAGVRQEEPTTSAVLARARDPRAVRVTALCGNKT
jgi:uncharacterized protein YfaS (alpha-2-macroglobulin family)